jgi:putative spermidine/putrescine transport system ATP-binding protein
MRLGLVTRGGTRLTVTLPAEAAARTLAGGRDLWVTWPATKGFLLPEDGAEQLAVVGV